MATIALTSCKRLLDLTPSDSIPSNSAITNYTPRDIGLVSRPPDLWSRTRESVWATRILYRHLDFATRTLGTYKLSRYKPAVLGILEFIQENPAIFDDKFEAKQRFVTRYLNQRAELNRSHIMIKTISRKCFRRRVGELTHSSQCRNRKNARDRSRAFYSTYSAIASSLSSFFWCRLSGLGVRLWSGFFPWPFAGRVCASSAFPRQRSWGLPFPVC